MKNKKGQLNIGGFLLLIIGIIVAATLLVAIAQGTDRTVNLRTSTNVTYTAPVTSGYIVLTGQNLLDTPQFMNASNCTQGCGVYNFQDAGNQTANSSVFTCGENVSASGTAQIYCKNNGYSTWSELSTRVTYTWGEAGYSNDSASRTMLLLVILLSAVALLVWVAEQSGLLDWIGLRD